MIKGACGAFFYWGEKMNFFRAIQEFEFSVSGGFAWYFLMCMGYVTITGAIQIIKFIINWINS